MKTINNIDIYYSSKNIDYLEALNMMEKRVIEISSQDKKELIWFLNHNHIYTIGTSGSKKEIRSKVKYPVIKTNRGGKMTYHGPGQRVIYFLIDLKKRKKDIRKFISVIENTIINTLRIYNIETFSDRENIGIWHKKNKKIKKVAAIGVRVSKWIAYHGFSINIDNVLTKYNAIIPCGINDKGVTNLQEIYAQNYDDLENNLIENFISNLKDLNV